MAPFLERRRMVMYMPLPRGRLYRETMTLLKHKDLRPPHRQDKTLRHIAGDSGLPYHWLKKISSGEIIHPSADRLEHLYTYLADKSWEL
jgi:hypothetical protein